MKNGDREQLVSGAQAGLATNTARVVLCTCDTLASQCISSSRQRGANNSSEYLTTMAGNRLVRFVLLRLKDWVLDTHLPLKECNNKLNIVKVKVRISI